MTFSFYCRVTLLFLLSLFCYPDAENDYSITGQTNGVKRGNGGGGGAAVPKFSSRPRAFHFITRVSRINPPRYALLALSTASLPLGSYFRPLAVHIAAADIIACTRTHAAVGAAPSSSSYSSSHASTRAE